jgi:hypothetical protein
MSVEGSISSGIYFDAGGKKAIEKFPGELKLRL